MNNLLKSTLALFIISSSFFACNGEGEKEVIYVYPDQDGDQPGSGDGDTKDEPDVEIVENAVINGMPAVDFYNQFLYQF